MLPLISTRGTLIAAAVVVQAVVLAAGWFATFRIIRGEFARVIEGRVLDQNADEAEKIKARLPTDIGEGVEYGDDRWEQLQEVIASTDEFTNLPAGGFACLIGPDGNILCHPDIERDPFLRTVNLGAKTLLVGDPEMPDSIRIDELEMNGAIDSGRVEFAIDDFHYVATNQIPGSDLRLLVHQPVKDLVRVGREKTSQIAVLAGVAIVPVLAISAGGLGFLLRRYDSVHERLNQKMTENLQIAQRVQRASLPRSLPTVAGFDIAAWTEPADETGGDTYDVVGMEPIDDGTVALHEEGEAARVGFLLADASGHGIGPALVATQLHALTRMAARLGRDVWDSVRFVNDQLSGHLPQGHFVTAWMAVLDRDSGVLRTVSAGQGPLLWYHAGSGEIETLFADLPPLGILDRAPVFATRELTLEPGDVFVVASDGFFEARSPDGELFGDDRVVELLRGSAGRPASQVGAELRDAVDAHAAGVRADDRTIVVIKRTA
ncbi:MAG: PP2C family protein-serine/threonine phosphatase [Planctomycetota bacterium]